MNFPANILIRPMCLLVVKTNELNYLKFNNIKLSQSLLRRLNFPFNFTDCVKIAFFLTEHRRLLPLLLSFFFSSVAQKKGSAEWEKEIFEFYSEEKVRKKNFLIS